MEKGIEAPLGNIYNSTHPVERKQALEKYSLVITKPIYTDQSHQMDQMTYGDDSVDRSNSILHGSKPDQVIKFASKLKAFNDHQSNGAS